MLKEEAELQKNIEIWNNEVKTVLSITRERLLSKGLSENRIDEDLARALFSNILKLAGGETANITGAAGSDSLLGGVGGGIQTAIEQSAIEKVVELLGLDPYTGMGNVLKNGIEQAIKQISQEDLISLMSANKAECMPIAEKLASITLESVEESAKEQILGIAISAVVGDELSVTVKKNAFTKPIYQNIREKFSDALDNFLSDEETHKSLSTVICDNINVRSILGDKAEDVKDAVSDAWTGATSNIDIPFSY